MSLGQELDGAGRLVDGRVWTLCSGLPQAPGLPLTSAHPTSTAGERKLRSRETKGLVQGRETDRGLRPWAEQLPCGVKEGGKLWAGDPNA